MRIEKVHIKGFRNFADAEFKLGNKTLVLGSNDSGKTNLLYALRILFDPGFSARQLNSLPLTSIVRRPPTGSRFMRRSGMCTSHVS